MKKSIVSALLVSAALAATSAQAATIIQISGGTADLTEALHANSAGAGNLLTLNSEPSDYLVDATSTNMISVGNGNGVAQIVGDGGPQSGFDNLMLDPQDPLLGFSAIHFKIDGLGIGQGQSASDADNFDLRVYFMGGSFQDFLNVALDSSNKYLVSADAGEVISSLSFSDMRAENGASAQFRSIKQVSFGPVTSAVPEPASWAMMIAGFGLMGTALRRRKTAVSFA